MDTDDIVPQQRTGGLLHGTTDCDGHSPKKTDCDGLLACLNYSQ